MNLGGLQPDLKGGLGGQSPPQEKSSYLFVTLCHGCQRIYREPCARQTAESLGSQSKAPGVSAGLLSKQNRRLGAEQSLRTQNRVLSAWNRAPSISKRTEQDPARTEECLPWAHRAESRALGVEYVLLIVVVLLVSMCC